MLFVFLTLSFSFLISLYFQYFNRGSGSASWPRTWSRDSSRWPSPGLSRDRCSGGCRLCSRGGWPSRSWFCTSSSSRWLLRRCSGRQGSAWRGRAQQSLDNTCLAFRTPTLACKKIVSQSDSSSRCMDKPSNQLWCQTAETHSSSCQWIQLVKCKCNVAPLWFEYHRWRTW